MGRQIRFYFVDSDEREFLILPQFEDAVFLKFRELESAQCELYCDINEKARSGISQNQTCICIKRDMANVKFLGREGRFLLDNYESPVIEFSRSGYKPELNLIVSGRLWYQHKYWTKDENGQDIIREKSKELERLYNSLVRWIKKHCTRLPNGNYIARHAMELHERGAKLS